MKKNNVCACVSEDKPLFVIK